MCCSDSIQVYTEVLCDSKIDIFLNFSPVQTYPNFEYVILLFTIVVTDQSFVISEYVVEINRNIFSFKYNYPTSFYLSFYAYIYLLARNK